MSPHLPGADALPAGAAVAPPPGPAPVMVVAIAASAAAGVTATIVSRIWHFSSGEGRAIISNNNNACLGLIDIAFLGCHRSQHAKHRQFYR